MRTAPLPYSEACERNQGPILGRLRRLLTGGHHVLEIGAGTGQHAVHFARAMPDVIWQPTDRVDHLPGLAARIAAEGTPNLLAPLELDVSWSRWPDVGDVDTVYSANTLHILSWPEVEAAFAGLGRLFPTGERTDRESRLVVYGPFRYEGRFTSDSNAAFDRSLRARDPESGIRDASDVDRLAARVGFELEADHPMPANNQLRVWRRLAC